MDNMQRKVLYMLNKTRRSTHTCIHAHKNTPTRPILKLGDNITNVSNVYKSWLEIVFLNTKWWYDNNNNNNDKSEISISRSLYLLFG